MRVRRESGIQDFGIRSQDESVLKICYYENDGRGYVKVYPKNAKYLDKIKKRYSENVKLMFDQLGYFAPVLWEKALTEFCQRIWGTDID